MPGHVASKCAMLSLLEGYCSHRPCAFMHVIAAVLLRIKICQQACLLACLVAAVSSCPLSWALTLDEERKNAISTMPKV
jgi:hypothetical protein